MADDDQAPWLQAPAVKSTQSGIATTFADPSDIQAYNQAKASGASEEDALKVGDNGIGHQNLGGVRTTNAYGVAVPEEQLVKQFGNDPEAWRKARAVVNMGGQRVTVPIVDVGPGQSAQAKGVAFDVTGPLAKALKSQGYDPAEISLLANAGPDYQADPTNWYAEQQKIRSSLPGAGPWSKAPVAGQPQPKETDEKPWLQAPAVKNEAQPKPSEAWKAAPIASNHPIAKANGWTLGQSIKNIWDVSKFEGAKSNYILAQSKVSQQVPDQIVEQQIAAIKASPYLDEQQKAQNIAAIQQGQQKEISDAQASLPQLKQQVSEAQQTIQKDNPNKAEQIIAGVGKYALSGATGPTGIVMAAQQATSEVYADNLDVVVKKIKQSNPKLSDAEVMTKAMDALANASKGSGLAMVALSAIPEAKIAGSLVKQIVAKIGLGAATMEIANTAAQVQRNLSLKKDVDPNQDWLEGLNDLAFHLQNLGTGAVFAAPHAFAEIGRPSAHPIEDRVPIAEVPEPMREPTKEESAAYRMEPETTEREKIRSVDISPTKEGKWQLTVNGEKGDSFDTEDQALAERSNLLQPAIEKDDTAPAYLSSESIRYGKQGQSDSGEKIVATAVKYEGNVIQGTTHPEAREEAVRKHGALAESRSEDGFVTSKGRFVDREEAWKIANPPPTTGTEQWLSSIANRYSQERSAAGELGAVEPGTGTTPQEMIAKGLRMGPERIAQHVSDLMQGKGDFKEQAAAVRAREAQLSETSARLSKLSETNPGDTQAKMNADEAFNDLTDFHNGPVAKLKSAWHAAGEGLQGELPVDLSSFNGLREAWLRDVGTTPSPRVEKTMRDTARKVREATAAEDASMKSLSKEIQKTSRKKLPTAEEVRNNIMARMKDDPCAV